jgi:uncharacterized damage-inducible protein DinB
MSQIRWFDRTFNFGQQNIFPSIIERLWGSPILYEYKTLFIPESILNVQYMGEWSILENIGHIIDLEPLWLGRLQDVLEEKEYLRDADLSNTKTHEANHNSRSLEDLIEEFHSNRANLMDQIQHLTEEQIFASAKHPRLDVPMRIMDLFLFVAEHDDHHLARISYLIKALS